MKIKHSYVQYVSETAEAELDQAVIRIRRAIALLSELTDVPNEVTLEYLKAAGTYRAAADLASEADGLELKLAGIERDRIAKPRAAA